MGKCKEEIRKALVAMFGIMLMMTLMAREPDTLRLVFAGDIMGHDSQIASALAMGNGEKYDYTSCFMYLEPYLSGADIAIGNLEVTLAGPPYKGYPAFSSPDALAEELKRVGFDILVNANNHAIDRRKKGLERTLDVLNATGLIQTGVFRDSASRAESYPLVVEKNGIRIALLNYTYGTNGIPVTPPNIVNYIDTLTIKQDLAKAATAEPDFTIVLMHWGSEYERQPNTTQEKLAAFLFSQGADAIIGSHPHVVQPVEVFPGGKLVVWSLGNFISNQRKRYTDGGILAEMTLVKNDTTWMSDHAVLPVWVDKPSTKKGTMFRLLPAAIDTEIQERIGMDEDASAAMGTFLEDTRKNLPGVPEAGFDFVYETE